jgi:hypothetical protein
VHPLLQKLQGGDRRSIGRSDEVAAEVAAAPELFDALFSGMLSADPIVRMRAADAAEKITAGRPEWLAPYKTVLLTQLSLSDQPEVRWHVALMLPRLRLNVRERGKALAILEGYLEDKSRIVKTCALQAMADLALADPALGPAVRARLAQALSEGTPAMKARSRKLLAALKGRSG